MAVDTDTAIVTRELVVPVTGMTCASCVRHVEKALRRVDGVANVTVNLATEKATVAFDPRAATLLALRASVERAGYGLLTERATLPTELGDQEAEAKEHARAPRCTARQIAASLGAGLFAMAVMFLPQWLYLPW